MLLASAGRLLLLPFGQGRQLRNMTMDFLWRESECVDGNQYLNFVMQIGLEIFQFSYIWKK